MTSELYTKDGDYILVVCPNPSVDIFAWLDHLVPGGCNRTTKEERYPGGKGVHVALALAELKEQVRLLGFWGGPTGSWIRSECEKRYSNLKCCGPLVQEWSRSCHTYKSGDHYDETEILGAGPVLTAGDLADMFTQFGREINGAKCVVLSGSWPPGIAGNEYQVLLKHATDKGKATFIDCTGGQLNNALKNRPYSVHLNRMEFYGQIGDEMPENGLVTIIKSCGQLALTDGSKGLYLMADEYKIHAISRVEKVHSAVGSGDCLVAGLAFAYCNGMNEFETARFAASCGAANCVRSDLGMLFENDVKHLFEVASARVTPGISDFELEH